MPFFIIFLIIPFLEISVFMAVGGEIGLFTTLLLALFTAILGGWVIRYQGLQTVLSFRSSANAGRIPEAAIFDGLCLVAAGALLITPGFVTDTIGFALLIPALRTALRQVLKSKISIFGADAARAPHGSRPHSDNSDILEGEYEDVSAPETSHKKEPDNTQPRIDRLDK